MGPFSALSRGSKSGGSIAPGPFDERFLKLWEFHLGACFGPSSAMIRGFHYLTRRGTASIAVQLWRRAPLNSSRPAFLYVQDIWGSVVTHLLKHMLFDLPRKKTSCSPIYANPEFVVHPGCFRRAQGVPATLAQGVVSLQLDRRCTGHPRRNSRRPSTPSNVKECDSLRDSFCVGQKPTGQTTTDHVMERF